MDLDDHGAAPSLVVHSWCTFAFIFAGFEELTMFYGR